MTDQIQSNAAVLSSQEFRKQRWVRIWLLTLGLIVYGIVLVGGATRLTDSGLSITEWLPISGSLPPLSDAEWAILFEKYQETAQYRFQNSGMSLDEFKFIFWWEWGHRQLGRVVGIVSLVGLIAFWRLKWIDARLGIRMAFIIGLGAVQAAIGWWMVASGIGEETTRVSVAPYRLMTHFSLALLIIAAIYWTWLDEARDRTDRFVSEPARVWALVLLGLISVQMAAGALVAGLDAGRTYTDWPLMANEVVPGSYWDGSLGWRNIFENAATAQFHHRLLAYILFAVSLVSVWRFWGQGEIGRLFTILAAVLTAQVIWGVITLVYVAPLELALVHQGLGVLVLLVAVRTLWRVSPPASRAGQG